MPDKITLEEALALVSFYYSADLGWKVDDVAGGIYGNVNCDVRGNVRGNVFGNVFGNISGTINS